MYTLKNNDICMSIPYPPLEVFKLRSNFVLAQLIFSGKKCSFQFPLYLQPNPSKIFMVRLFLYLTDFHRKESITSVL